MNPQSTAIAGSRNPKKSHFESEIQAKLFSKSANPFAYSSLSSLVVIPLIIILITVSLYYKTDIQGCALAEPGGPWRLTFALGRLENLTFFIQIICWAP